MAKGGAEAAGRLFFSIGRAAIDDRRPSPGPPPHGGRAIWLASTSHLARLPPYPPATPVDKGRLAASRHSIARLRRTQSLWEGPFFLENR